MPDLNDAQLHPNQERLWADLEALSVFRNPDGPGWMLRAFSPEHLAARRWLHEHMEQAGLATSIDAAGNPDRPALTHGRRDLDPIMIGSHTDSIQQTGCQGGIVGVLAGIEVARCLQESGTALDHPLEIVDFVAAGAGPDHEWHLGAQAMVRSIGRGRPGSAGASDGLREAIIAARWKPRRSEARIRSDDRARWRSSWSCTSSRDQPSPRNATLGIASSLPDAWDLRVKLETYPLLPASALAQVRERATAAAADIRQAFDEIWEQDGWTITATRRDDLEGATPSLNLRFELAYHDEAAQLWPLPMPAFRERFEKIVEARSVRGSLKSMLALRSECHRSYQEILATTANDLGVATATMPSRRHTPGTGSSLALGRHAAASKHWP